VSELGTHLNIMWQDVAAWLTVVVAAVYVIWYFRRGEGGHSVGCSGCSHCPMLSEIQR
jgi:heme/copper-type cytochrome/quinol oxidase subunit 2